MRTLPVPHRALFAFAGLLAALLGARGRSGTSRRSEPLVDELTGLLTRRALLRRVEELEAQAPLTSDPVAVITAAIDHSTQGADPVLFEVARRLRTELRAFDLVYRVGADEFLVLLPGADVGEAVVIAERLREAIACWPIGELNVTLSCGVAATYGEAFDHETILAAADEALHEAKARGRDRVVAAHAILVAA